MGFEEFMKARDLMSSFQWQETRFLKGLPYDSLFTEEEEEEKRKEMVDLTHPTYRGPGEYSMDEGQEDETQRAIYRRITLEPGEIRDALTDWINKKTSGAITPNWNTFSFQTRRITEEPLWSLRIEGLAKVLMPEKTREGDND